MSSPQPRRSQRERRVASYVDDAYAGDSDDDGGGPSFDILEIVQTADEDFTATHVKKMSGKDFNLDYVMREGLTVPLLFESRDGLGLRVPPGEKFTVKNIRNLVGAQRPVDVMDCSTQEALVMSMQEWTEYYYSQKKTKLLNVISLEFSKSKLDPLVRPPDMVREVLDWVELVWPQARKSQQRTALNTTADMKYPKVQKYCLMSVRGCYTDFHIDFGGTSVWYHLLRGQKIFFLIPPTSENLNKFERWSKGGQQENEFFGHQCPDCSVIKLEAGQTFMIPTGWIHAVYTPQDSLVFGGNFLHRFNVHGQIEIMLLEKRLKVPERYLFPFWDTIHWYYAQAVSYRAQKEPYYTFSAHEQRGIKELLVQLPLWLAHTRRAKHIPAEIAHPEDLITSLAFWMESKEALTLPLKSNVSPPSEVTELTCSIKTDESSPERRDKKYEREPWKPSRNFIQRASTICDSSKSISRPARRMPDTEKEKQPLLHRKTAHKSKSQQKVGSDLSVSKATVTAEDAISTLPEGHIQRLKRLGVDIASSFEDSLTPLGDSKDQSGEPSPLEYAKALGMKKRSPPPPEPPRPPLNKRRKVKEKPKVVPEKPLAKQNLKAIYSVPGLAPEPKKVKFTKAPQIHVVPSRDSQDRTLGGTLLKYERGYDHPHERESKHQKQRQILSRLEELASQQAHIFAWGQLPDSIWLSILRLVSPGDLCACAKTCRQLARLANTPMLWQEIDMAYLLTLDAGIKRASKMHPVSIDLSWTALRTEQLQFLIQRCSRLEKLSIVGCQNVFDFERAFRHPSCHLRELDLSWNRNVTDDALRVLVLWGKTLVCLKLGGTQVSDAGFEKFARGFPSLRTLDLYQCSRIADGLITSILDHCPNIETLDLRGTLISSRSVVKLSVYRMLVRADFRDCPSVSESACQRLAQSLMQRAVVTHKLVECYNSQDLGL